MLELRDHPLLQRHRFSAWPPVWTNLTSGGGSYAGKKGEIGTLTRVIGTSAVQNICFLFIEHDGESYCGALIVDNGAFCAQLVDFLQEHVGKSIEAIGDLDLSELVRAERGHKVSGFNRYTTTEEARRILRAYFSPLPAPRYALLIQYRLTRSLLRK